MRGVKIVLSILLLSCLSWVPTVPARSAPKPPAATGKFPTLGSPEADWIAHFGKPVKADSATGTPDDELHYQPCGNRPKDDRLIIHFENYRASWISFGWCIGEQYPSLSERRALAHQFMPADAKRRGSRVLETGSALEVYVSGTVMRYFPVYDFQDCDGNAVPKGTFTIDPGTDPTQHNYWDIQVGTCA